MKYLVTHRTIYTYDDDVTDSLGIAHVVPRSLPWQHVTDPAVTVSPVPADQSSDADFYGNTVTYFQVLTPHKELEVDAVSHVEVSAPAYDDSGFTQPWESARPLDDPSLPGAWRACDMAVVSPLIEHTAEAAAYGAESLTPGRPLVEAAAELMHRIHADFAYDKTATTVTSTIDEIFSAQGGVCQDFAHLMIACLRTHGLAARYVSGYLATTPPPGTPRLVGADASHAWVAVWVPAPVGEGEWVMLDPTNDQWVDERYVTVAWGRDYADVPPVKGVIFTEAKKSTLAVSVDVAPVV
ncbi:transglutaminase family protein [Nocardioides sp. Kera G14]|uniref:transglutaminase family protein n=1 Tax=Nocardioides sp. Kera G14 TaxID=2884264 RepID=UPI001D1051B5|nr:transglutaminase family protein [Nocardioides sp. Kera G14]UDY23259.1 transglutaminase family protein [Nocardioides sp. Kera G14]